MLDFLYTNTLYYTPPDAKTDHITPACLHWGEGKISVQEIEGDRDSESEPRHKLKAFMKKDDVGLQMPENFQQTVSYFFIE